MAAPSLDEGFEIDAPAFFSLKNWKTAILPQRRVARDIQGVYLVGSELADDTKTVANPWNTDGSLKAGAAQNIYSSLPVRSAWPMDMSVLADTGQIAGDGGAAGSIPASSFTPLPYYEIWAAIYSYKCDATVVTRTTVAAKYAFFGVSRNMATGVTTSVDAWASSTLSLTASQDGVLTLETGGTEAKNQAGTLTFATSKLWLPLVVDTVSITITAATAGVAGDVHRGVVIGRQIV